MRKNIYFARCLINMLHIFLYICQNYFNTTILLKLLIELFIKLAGSMN